MIIRDKHIQHLSTEEHSKRFKNIVYADNEKVVYITKDKRYPFIITPNDEERRNIYIDLFALTFGLKEKFHKRDKGGLTKLRFGCSRTVRDEILYLPEEEIISLFYSNNCRKRSCQYWSHPTGLTDRKYAFTCILARYRTLNVISMKQGFTLEEVGRCHACTRERIRQIEEKALNRLRHKSRSDKMRVFKGYENNNGSGWTIFSLYDM